MHAWLWLIGAILFEVAGTTSLKLSYGCSKAMPTFCTFFFYAISFYLLSITLKTMDVSLSYALWAGLGTALVACVGVVYFGEAISWIKIISLALIIIGVIGLKLANAH